MAAYADINGRLKLADALLGSRHPMLVLRVPDCILFGLNRRHMQTASLGFVDAERYVLETRDSVLSAMESAASASSGQGVLMHRLKCYCSQVSAILALRKHDCVYESAVQQFASFGPNLKVVPSWEFNLDKMNSQDPARRVYFVSRVYSHQVPDQRDPAVLVVRLVPSQTLRLVVDGLPHPSAKLQVTLQYGAQGHRVDGFTSSPIPDDKKWRPYKIVDEYLEKAANNPRQLREFLDRAAQEIRTAGNGEGYPVEDVLDTIAGEGILRTRARLWDAPVIGAEARSTLDTLIAQQRLVNESQPLPIRADLAGLQLSLDHHLAADIYAAVRN
jgi:hypothetical protein